MVNVLSKAVAERVHQDMLMMQTSVSIFGALEWLRTTPCMLSSANNKTKSLLCISPSLDKVQGAAKLILTMCAISSATNQQQ
mmetsp:Transcript_7738/g.15562  ORF Transcript_7738/g.15562 Transcript_7738/m.15562 type:complete len:82 (-) Transcript_7738:316-561(-)